MSYSPWLHTSRSHTSHLLVPVGVTTTLIALALDALGVWGDGSPFAEPKVSDFLFSAALTLVTAALVFGVVVPRANHRRVAGAVALVLGGVALVLGPFFWLGIAGVLGVGAVLLGLENSHAGRNAALARAGVALGAVGAVAYVLMYALDWMNTNNVL